MAISILILRILELDFGFDTRSRVDVTLGHSLGEFSALIAAGHLKFADALRLVRHRAEVMAQCTRQVAEKSGEDYGMVALICEPERLEGLLLTIHDFLDSRSEEVGTHSTPPIQRVVVANINSPNQIVLSGSIERIRTLLVQLRQFGGHDPRAVRLKSESPFHSPVMLPAAEYTKKILDGISITFPAPIPCVSNISALPFQSTEDLKLLLSRQCTDTVRWWDSIRYLHQTRGVRRWIGIGPGKVGRNLVGKEVGRVDTKGGGVWAVSNPKEMEIMMAALSQTEVEIKAND
ncbi:Acyl transferase/acyl hydrolase/lysophospholipase [Penicillium chermesinum]|uniref:[acyl-carrier-protein] S-malonyltransferase n=1 Tax=Penicillium chermesinum TaxID=63820 RepID=A0A9W9P8T2_9EURO|nr:Acyl transferase/acyl hydrolase/lysophospholipase [Penicillium chermesinum]KAJ5238678.1 Acyl transferase/acyl hydrolase/lysophospholipase [Penicillium chermesinum]